MFNSFKFYFLCKFFFKIKKKIQNFKIKVSSKFHAIFFSKFKKKFKIQKKFKISKFFKMFFFFQNFFFFSKFFPYDTNTNDLLLLDVFSRVLSYYVIWSVLKTLTKHCKKKSPMNVLSKLIHLSLKNHISCHSMLFIGFYLDSDLSNE